ncbi:UNVERIFIED_CONTAM: hypothetical protein GTU68_000818 [Idotea baltica]|nr:hypothetical protein [Idotea baltica]
MTSPGSRSSKLHSRSKHRLGYDFAQLVEAHAGLKPFVRPNKYGRISIDFFNAQAVKELNKALLIKYYNVGDWDIPAGYLCPPIPGRADYIHYLADLLAGYNDRRWPQGRVVTGLDIGTGASVIYPIIAQSAYGWSMVASETDQQAYQNAEEILQSNDVLKDNISVRFQPDSNHIFKDIINAGEYIDFVMCNPPFYDSPEAATKSSYRKHKNLSNQKALKFTRNFGGQPHELWCDGGELTFIKRIMDESRLNSSNCFMFTSLVSNEKHLPNLIKHLQKTNARDVQVVDMAQGNKVSRFIAWTFLTQKQQQIWVDSRW